MITYNHEKFIKESIEGVLMQECEFEIELIVADDCSPDATQFIVESIIKEHPRGCWIKYVKHSENLGVMPNFVWAMSQCSGDYIALCEGDDYWTDPLKLQKQVEFLEANPDYSIAFHNATVIDEHSSVISGSLLNPIPNEEYTSLEIMEGGVIPTATVMFRNNLLCLPKSFKTIFNGDTFLFALLAQHGKAKYLKDIKNSFRRIHKGGVWSSLTEYQRLKKGTNTFFKILKVIEVKYKPIIARVISNKLDNLLKMHLQNYNLIFFIKDLCFKYILEKRYKI
ncbi:glycosyltransferase [Snuella lapsa]